MRQYTRAALLVLLVLVSGLVVWRWSRQPAPAIPLLTGQVVDAGGPVSGARVRVQTRSDLTLSDSSGRFALPAPAEAAAITAWKDGYRIGSARSDQRPLTIALERLPERDDDAYRWIEPGPSPPGTGANQCGDCHAAIFDEWRGSAHGRPHEGSRFRALFLGLDARGQPGGWGLMPEHPDGENVCASCHDPAPLSRAAAEEPDRRFAGVHCDFCHKIAGPGRGDIGLTHGKYGLQLLRGPVIFGPLEDAARGSENTFSPLQRQSRLCASCHEGVVFGVRVYETFSEWQASPAARAGVQCQNCHMKPTGQMTNMAPGHGGVERDPAMLANHTFFDGSQREMLSKCLRLTLEVAHNDDAVRAAVEVRAENVGHRVPTGLPDRNLTLEVEAVDAAGKPLAARTGPTWEGRAGKLFAKRLKDWEGRSPVPFWRAAPEFDDTRLLPGTPVRLEFAFPPGATRVSAKLVYRKFWPEVSRAKGWPDDAWVVAEVRSK